jgi:uncharacterized OB-fold protein
MTWEPRPLPEHYPEAERFWRAATEEKLLLRECADCGLIYHYPRDVCPDCLHDDVAWVESEGTGHVYSYTVVHQLQGWPEEDLPLLLAYVELDEGLQMLTLLVDCSPGEVEVGVPVKVVFRPTDEADIAIPVFKLHS